MKRQSIGALALACALMPALACAEDRPSPQQEALKLINDTRRSVGLLPLAWSAPLAQAAQRHSEDMASKGFVDVIGTDGSTTATRARAAGYAGWDERFAVREAVFAGPNGFMAALEFMLGNIDARRALLGRRYREVGVGVSYDAQRAYWSVVVGVAHLHQRGRANHQSQSNRCAVGSGGSIS